MSKRRMTPKQRLFAQEYLVDLNATQAAIRAGYSSRTARDIGSENLRKPAIQAFIQEAMQKRAANVELTADRVLRELMRVGLSDIGQLFGKDGGIRPMHEMPEDARRALSSYEEVLKEDGSLVRKVRLWDKPRALEMLGKHLKLFVEVLEAKVEVDGFSDEERAERIASLLERARTRRAERASDEDSVSES